MATLNIKRAVKAYGTHPVLHGVDIALGDGEFLVLVGPSGCGKSTLLRMIAGLESITSGDIMIDGKVVNDVPPRDRDIAMVFQDYALYPHKSVAENMSFGLRMRGAGPDEIKTKVNAAAQILQIEHLLERRPSQLSGGQRQRVAMGRAIVRDPKLFLFDEPLSNLDAQLRAEMRIEIKKLHQRLKNTIVYVTHDQVEAMTLADRIVIMRGGNIEQIGTPDEVYNHPCSAFVAGFIGSPPMNFATARLAPDGKSIALSDTVKFDVPEKLRHAARGAGGKTVKLGIRPEHVTLGGADALQAKVILIEPLGAETLALIRIGAIELTGRFPPDAALKPGMNIQVNLAASKIHVFDETTGVSFAN